MKFIFTKHANLRINQRELSKRQVIDTIINPDKILPGFKGCFLARKKFADKILEVAYKRFDQKIIVITVYWLKEV